MSNIKISIVIPSYKVKKHIVGVLKQIPKFVWRIYVIDDACPENTGNYVLSNFTDSRITVICNKINQGVGGAVMTGYHAAVEDGADIIVKLDGDGQMNPSLIPVLIAPILSGEADYTKGNRFFNLEGLRKMPRSRLFGNTILSFITKITSGYWDLFDPTNGYTAIHSEVARLLPYNKISKRFFFETDLLFRLNTLRAVVIDIPMDAYYGDEESNLKISKSVMEFVAKHILCLSKRIFYNYYLRDMSLASIELPIGFFLAMFGVIYGGWHWLFAVMEGIITPVGTVMLSAVTILVGLQLILAFLSYDIATVPRRPIHAQNQVDKYTIAGVKE